VRAEIAGAGVRTDLVFFDSRARTGVYFKDPRPGATSVPYHRDGPAASGMAEEDADRALARPPRILHLTGITPALSPSCARAVDTAVLTAWVTDEVSRDGRDRTFRLRLTETWVRTRRAGGAWPGTPASRRDNLTQCGGSA